MIWFGCRFRGLCGFFRLLQVLGGGFGCIWRRWRRSDTTHLLFTACVERFVLTPKFSAHFEVLKTIAYEFHDIVVWIGDEISVCQKFLQIYLVHVEFSEQLLHRVFMRSRWSWSGSGSKGEDAAAALVEYEAGDGWADAVADGFVAALPATTFVWSLDRGVFGE